MTVSEYQDNVGPLNRHFMEIAAFQYLARQGVFRKEAEDNESSADGAVKPKTEVRGTSKDGFAKRESPGAN